MCSVITMPSIQTTNVNEIQSPNWKPLSSQLRFTIWVHFPSSRFVSASYLQPHRVPNLSQQNARVNDPGHRKFGHPVFWVIAPRRAAALIFFSFTESALSDHPHSPIYLLLLKMVIFVVNSESREFRRKKWWWPFLRSILNRLVYYLPTYSSTPLSSRFHRILMGAKRG